MFKSILTSISSIPSRVISALGSIVSQIRSTVVSTFSVLTSQIRSTVTSVINGILGGLAGLPRTISNLLGGVTAAVSGPINRAISSIIGAVSGISRTVTSIISSRLGSIQSFLTNIGNNILSGLSNIVTSVQRVISPILQSVQRFIGNIPAIIGNQFNSVTSFLTTSFNALRQQADASLRTLFAVTSGVSAQFQNFTSGFSSFAESVGQQFTGLANLPQQLAGGLINGFKFALDGIKTQIIDPILNGVASLPSALRALVRPRGSITPEEARDILNTAGPTVLAVYAAVNTAAAIGEFVSFGQYDEVFRGVIDTLDDIGADVFATDFVTFDYETGIKPALAREVLKRYTPMIPGAGDLVRMVVREAFVPEFRTPAPDRFAEAMSEQGFDRFWADTFWTAHWTPFEMQTAVDAFHRGLIDRNDLLRRLIILDFRPDDASILSTLIFKLPNRIEARLMARFGLLSDEQLQEIIRAQGIREDFVEPLRVMMQEFALTRIFTRTESAAIGASEDGLISDGEFAAMMELIKRPPGVIEADIELGRFKRQLDFKRFQVSTVEKVMRRGQITLQEGTSKLTELGLDTERIALIVGRIQFDLDFRVSPNVKSKAPKLTASQMLSALKKKVISVEETLEALLAKGYNEAEADILIKTATGAA